MSTYTTQLLSDGVAEDRDNFDAIYIVANLDSGNRDDKLHLTLLGPVRVPQDDDALRHFLDGVADIDWVFSPVKLQEGKHQFGIHDVLIVDDVDAKLSKSNAQLLRLRARHGLKSRGTGYSFVPHVSFYSEEHERLLREKSSEGNLVVSSIHVSVSQIRGGMYVGGENLLELAVRVEPID